MPAAAMFLPPSPHKPPFAALASGDRLLHHARLGSWRLDVDDLPDDLRRVYWSAAVCFVSIDWLLAAGPDLPQDADAVAGVVRDLHDARTCLETVLPPLLPRLRQTPHRQTHGGPSLKNTYRTHLSGGDAVLALLGACQERMAILTWPSVVDAEAVATLWPHVAAQAAVAMDRERSDMSIALAALGAELLDVASDVTPEPTAATSRRKQRKPRSGACAGPDYPADDEILRCLRGGKALTKKELSPLIGHKPGYVINRIRHLKNLGLVENGDERHTYRLTMQGLQVAPSHT